MEFALIAAVVAALIALVALRKKEDSAFKVCWASGGWRSCYGKKVKLTTADVGFPVLTMEGAREPHYLVKPHGDITGAKNMVVTLRVDLLDGDNPFFYAKDAKSDTVQATMSAFFQRDGDDMYAKGNKQFYRWWSVDTLNVRAGVQTLIVPLHPEANEWTSVYGKRCKAHTAEFEAAKKECRQIGVTFGGGGGRGHGIRIRDGRAEIKILSCYVV